MPKEKDPYAPWLSCWFITYNTNRANDRLIPILEDAWQHILTNILDYLSAWSSPTIRVISVQERHALERGDKFHKIHIHSELKVDSEGMSMLDYTKVTNSMNQYIKDEYERLHHNDEDYQQYTVGKFHSRLIYGCNSARSIEKYLKKAPIREFKRTEVTRILEGAPIEDED
jgi:hypothetical protein